MASSSSSSSSGDGSQILIVIGVVTAVACMLLAVAATAMYFIIQQRDAQQELRHQIRDLRSAMREAQNENSLLEEEQQASEAALMQPVIHQASTYHRHHSGIPAVPVTLQSPVRVFMDSNVGLPPVTFPQVGYLQGQAGGRRVPLYGSESAIRRGRWNYYVMQDGVKVGLVSGTPPSTTRNCLDEIACEELFPGDDVTIEGDAADDKYSVHVYDRNMSTWNLPRPL